MSENILSDKTRSLIAVGASISANCQPCLKNHVAKALENGAAKEEIVEAIEVGKAVRTGAAGSMDELVAEIESDQQNTCSILGDSCKCCCN